MAKSLSGTFTTERVRGMQGIVTECFTKVGAPTTVTARSADGNKFDFVFFGQCHCSRPRYAHILSSRETAAEDKESKGSVMINIMRWPSRAR